MSDAKTKRSTPAEQEAALMDSAEEMFEKSASALSAEDQEKFAKVDADRFEDRPPAGPDDKDATKDDDETPTRPTDTRWGSKPSIRGQMAEQPSSVRLVNPETKILTLSKPADLAEYNRLLKASADPETPTLAISVLEKQPYEGSWVVFITYQEVQYMQF
jgi:hypothetical protein